MSASHPAIGVRRIDVDELVEAYEASASDPDAPVTARQRGLLLTGAINGCRIGMANAASDLPLPNCGPVLITVSRETLERIHSC